MVEQTKSVRYFRGLREIEEFYRFIYENDLRREAKKVLEFVNNRLNQGKKKAKK